MKKHTPDIRLILQRLEGLLGVKSEKAAAKRLGVAPQTYSNWKSRGTVPWDILYNFCEEENHDFEWLINGRSPEPHPYPTGWEFEEIRKYKTLLSGSPGSQNICEDESGEGVFAFRKDWSRKKGTPEKLGLFEVIGDSMYPTICNGDTVLVDLSDSSPQSIQSGKIYTIAEGAHAKVKKLAFKGSELWIYSSKESGEEPYRAPEHESLQIIGRVVWVGHELK